MSFHTKSAVATGTLAGIAKANAVYTGAVAVAEASGLAGAAAISNALATLGGGALAVGGGGMSGGVLAIAAASSGAAVVVGLAAYGAVGVGSWLLGR